jgi:hypothetical protein
MRSEEKVFRDPDGPETPSLSFALVLSAFVKILTVS